MLNVFVKLSDGRKMTLEDVIRDYERLLNEEASKKIATSEPKADSQAVPKLKVGEWFRIDRKVIAKNREKIRRVCYEAGDIGEWKRFEESNKIADKNPYQYPCIIETYIFKHNWEYKTEQEMRDMCKEIGDGECDEVICDLELQMRICNGESAHALFHEYDKLPCVRVIQLRNGATGYFGCGAGFIFGGPPSALYMSSFYPSRKNYKYTPYAFRRVPCGMPCSTEHCFVVT